MSSMRYLDMKDSGVEWICEIPSHWKTQYLFQVVQQVKNKNKDLKERNLLSLSYGKVKRKDIDTTDGLLPASFDGYNIVENGDIVLRLTDLQNDHTSLRVGLVTERGIITSAYITVRSSNIYAPYLYLVLHSFDVRKGFYGMGSGVRQGLNFDETKKIVIPIPPHAEQEAIAAYLDEKSAAIDEIIQQAKASIEEYKAWKASVIFEAVTKGLDPNAEMKDSGIYGIGIIPVASKVIKIRYLINYIESGVSVNAGQDPAQDGEFGVLKTSAVSQNIFLPSENKNVNIDEYDRVACPVKANTIIVSRMNTPELVGACGFVEYDYDNLFLPDRLWQVHFVKGCNVKYIWYYLCSGYVRNYYASLSTGTSSSMQNISQGQFLDVRILLPTEEEQKKTVIYLDKICAAIDTIIAEKNALIDELETYKKSLIFEIVTGKQRIG